MRDPTATRERIERAALRLFAERGVDAVSVRDIAQAAGVADGALYRHHRSREALVASLFREHTAALVRRLASLRDAEPRLAGALRAMVAELYALFDGDPDLFAFLLLVQHGQLKRLHPDDPSPVELVVELLRRAMARGELPKQNPQLAAALVLGIVLQPAVFAVYGRLRPPLAALTEDVTGACLRALQAPSAPPAWRDEGNPR